MLHFARAAAQYLFEEKTTLFPDLSEISPANLAKTILPALWRVRSYCAPALPKPITSFIDILKNVAANPFLAD